MLATPAPRLKLHGMSLAERPAHARCRRGQAGLPCLGFAAASRMAAFMDRAGVRLNRQFADYHDLWGVVGRRSRRLLAEASPIGTGGALRAARPRAVLAREREAGGRSGFRVPRSTFTGEVLAPCRGGRDRAASRSVTRRRTARERSELGGPRRPGGKGWPRRSAGSAWRAATGWGATCPTRPTRSWPSSPAPPSGPHGSLCAPDYGARHGAGALRTDRAQGAPDRLGLPVRRHVARPARGRSRR